LTTKKRIRRARWLGQRRVTAAAAPVWGQMVEREIWRGGLSRTVKTACVFVGIVAGAALVIGMGGALGVAC
jgi:hypothetical protein